jgi:LysM repeat protein
MRNRLFPILLLSLFSGLYSCKTYKPLVSSSEPSQNVNDYINLYKDLAVSEMKRTGIPASITLAQAIIESDCGHSYIAREANNHFGIKCHDGWSGPSIKHTDNSRNECFRKYQRAEESFYDHSDFLKSTSRYSFLFSLGSTDYKAWAHGLKKAGYATNPDYANMLIRTIDQNSLWSYDKGYNYPNTITHAKTPDKLPSSTDTTRISPANHSGDSTKKVIQAAYSNRPVLARVPRIAENNRVQFIIVKDGETKEKIENEFQLLKWELSRYNELKSDFVPVPGQMLYLQPKRDKAEAGNEFYTSVNGDTMYKIAQQFGVKLKSLYEMNRMEDGAEPVAGSKIWLRKIKPVQ